MKRDTRRGTSLPRRGVISWCSSVCALFALGASPRTAASTCAEAEVRAFPEVLQFETVLRDAVGRRAEPNFGVSIELPDGSAEQIDLGTLTLNGAPVAARAIAVGDSDRDGTPDVALRLNRGALLASDGRVAISGATAAGACFAGEARVELLPLPTERSELYVPYTASAMPDARLDGVTADLHVRRLRPAGGIPAAAALVLVQGRTIAGTAAFDLRLDDYSLMERLAERGIDAFAVDLLGFGPSSLPAGSNPLDEPRNASLPGCRPLDQTDCSKCTPVGCPRPAGAPPDWTSPVGISCDCQGWDGRAFLTVEKLDQQAAPRYLDGSACAEGPPCAHGSPFRFQGVAHQVDQLALVVAEVRRRTGLSKVYLLGLSFGGPVVGRYLADGPKELRDERQDGVAGAIFLASSFGASDTTSMSSWPLGLIDRADLMTNFSGCEGTVDPGISDALWGAMQELDPVGRRWGPEDPVTHRRDGLSRYPTLNARIGWNGPAAQRIAVPALVMNGARDTVVRVAASEELWYSSAPQAIPEVGCTTDADCAPGFACKSLKSNPAAPWRCRRDDRVLAQDGLECASHGLLWETCSTPGCVAPHRLVATRIRDWILARSVDRTAGASSPDVRGSR